MRDEYPDILENPPPITDLTLIYKAAKARFDAEPEFKTRAQLTVVELQSGDESCKQVWELLCRISRTEFQKVYDRLDVTLTECGESFYNSLIPGTLEYLNEKGLTKESDGATVVFLDHWTYPLIVKKRDGGYVLLLLLVLLVLLLLLGCATAAPAPTCYHYSYTTTTTLLLRTN